MLFEIVTLLGFGYLAMKKPKTPPVDADDDAADADADAADAADAADGDDDDAAADDAAAPAKKPTRVGREPAKTPTTPPAKTPPAKTPTTPPKTAPTRVGRADPPSSLTDLEKVTAQLAVKAQPQEHTAAPTDDLRYRGKRLLPDWLANWVYWTLYVMPESAWVKSGKAAGPWKFTSGDKSPFVAVWTRIRAYIDTLELTPVAKPAPAGSSAPPTSLTDLEKITAQVAAKAQPQEHTEAPTDELRYRGKRLLPDWLANWVYWTLYVMPESAWVKSGKTPGPWKFTSGDKSPFVAVWNRIRAYIGTLELKPAAKPADADADADDADAAALAAKYGLTNMEWQTADFVLWARPKSVDASIVPPPTNTRAAQSDATWLANVTYWTVYRSPSGEWIKSGKAAGPVSTPVGSTWAAAWLRIQKYLIARGATK